MTPEDLLSLLSEQQASSKSIISNLPSSRMLQGIKPTPVTLKSLTSNLFDIARANLTSPNYYV